LTAAYAEIAGASKLVQSIAATIPKIEFPTLSVSSELGPSFAADILRSSGWAAVQSELASNVSAQMRSVLAGLRPVAATIVQQQQFAVRAVALEQGFVADTAGAGARFGRLHTQFESSPRLAAEVAGFAHAAAHPGATAPIDVPELRTHTLNIERILNEEPALRDQLAQPLAEAAELNDYDVINLGETLGLIDAVRRHRVSSLGVVAAATVGMVRFVVGAGTVEPLPMTMYEAIRDGSGMYAACVALRNRTGTGNAL
jgi:hypothetical protein